jgi:opacity protein-like surface antigen
MKTPRSLAPRWIAGLLAAAAALAPASALAGGSDADVARGVSIGGNATYFRAKDADHGYISPGVQLRVHLSPMFALEGTIDYRKEQFGGTVVDVYPVQASLLVYLFPSSRLTPYVLGGGGWYYTHVRSPDHTQYRFGPHLGAGLKLSLNRSWSVDGSYRYLWTTDVHSTNVAHPAGQNFSDNGFMLTAGLNYHF